MELFEIQKKMKDIENEIERLRQEKALKVKALEDEFEENRQRLMGEWIPLCKEEIRLKELNNGR